MSVLSEIKGAAELRKAINELAPKVGKRVLRRAMRASARVLQKGIRAGVSSLDMDEEGKARLKKAIAIATGVRGKPGQIIVGVRVRSVPKNDGKQSANDPMVWWWWFERGTRMRASKRGQRAGQLRAQAFAEPAYDRLAQEALDVFAATARPLLEKEVGVKRFVDRVAGR